MTKERMSLMNKLDTGHLALLDSLVQNRLKMKFIVFAEVGIGSRWLQQGSIPVPDVMTMRYSYTKSDISIYEVKDRRQDFNSDVGQAKYRRYLPFCDRFYFASSAKMITKAEVPTDAGLIVYSADKDSWSVVKASPRHEANLTEMDWKSLLMAKYTTEKRVRRLKDRIVWQENSKLSEKITGLDLEVKKKLEEVEGVECRIRDIKYIVASGLGIDPEELYSRSSYELDSYIKKVAKGLVIPPEKQLAMEIMETLATLLSGGCSVGSWDREQLRGKITELAVLLEDKTEIGNRTMTKEKIAPA